MSRILGRAYAAQAENMEISIGRSIIISLEWAAQTQERLGFRLAVTMTFEARRVVVGPLDRGDKFRSSLVKAMECA
jgi:hypothetical protein